jgi:peptidyl-prolyl cis-trans isomerase C
VDVNGASGARRSPNRRRNAEPPEGTRQLEKRITIMTVLTANGLSRLLFAVTILGAATAVVLPAGGAKAQEDPNKVVAIVDGEQITLGDLSVAARDMQQDLAQVPPDLRMQMVIDAVVEIKLFEKAAIKEGLDKTEPVLKRLALLRARALRNEYLLNKVAKVVTDEEVKKRYDEEAAKFVAGDELHLYHILVKTEDEAKAVIADLDKGGDFEKIAKEKSSDPGSGSSGGDLGFIGKGKTVQPFEDAAFKLDVGQYTKTPVQSQFGWHVIKLTEKRKQEPPAFGDRQASIRQELLTQFLQAEVKALRDSAKIEIIQEKPASDAAPADQPKPTTP